jgi:hypothetical protein
VPFEHTLRDEGEHRQLLLHRVHTRVLFEPRVAETFAPDVLHPGTRALVQ